MRATIMSRFSAKTPFLVLPAAVLAALLITTACSDSKAAKAGGPQAMPVKVHTAAAQKSMTPPTTWPP